MALDVVGMCGPLWPRAALFTVLSSIPRNFLACRDGRAQAYYCRIGDLVAADIAKRQAASVYLKSLAELGLLEEIKAGRENLYINPRLLALLSDRPPSKLDR